MKRFIDIVLSGLAIAAMTAAVLATVVLCFSVLVLVGAIRMGLFVAELQKVDVPVFAPLEATAKAGMILTKTVAKFAIREGSPVVIQVVASVRSAVIKLIARAVVGGRQLRQVFDFDSLIGLAVFAAGV
jgi:hypothetical protein